LGRYDRVDILCAVAAILVAISCVDLLADGGIGVRKSYVFLQATSVDAAFVASPRAAEPGGIGPVGGLNVEIFAEPDNPDYHWFA
jgi:hypothetical protein